MTPQQQLTETLKRSGIPAREVRCFGSQVMITTIGEDTARRWAMLLNNFCSKVRGPGQGYDDKPNVTGRPEYIKVWRVWGTI
jgi:hypothetical protein